jgi:hypothetical protein
MIVNAHLLRLAAVCFSSLTTQLRRNEENEVKTINLRSLRCFVVDLHRVPLLLRRAETAALAGADAGEFGFEFFLLAGFQIEAAPFGFLNDAFSCYLPFKPAESLLQTLAGK